MADLLEKCLKPHEVSKVELCNQILLEQFLVDLDESTQCYVRCHRPKLSAEALQLAEDFDSAQAEGNRERGPKTGPNHISQENERKETQEGRQSTTVCF